MAYIKSKKEIKINVLLVVLKILGFVFSLLFYLFNLFFCKGRAPSSPVDKNGVIRLFMVIRGLDPEFRASHCFIRLNNIS